jgi:hypothetical protein
MAADSLGPGGLDFSATGAGKSDLIAHIPSNP